MSVLLLTEDDVRRLLPMDMALEAVEQGLRKMGLDEAENVPRSRAQTDHSMLHTLSAAIKSLGVMGVKVYATSRKGPTQFHLSLFDGKTGALLCLMQADHLGQMRTGAASGVATNLMARPDAAEVGVYGSGKQARTQLMAICKVRRVRQVHVYSHSDEHRRQFAVEMSEKCQTEVVPTSHPERAAENKDVVVTATNSREPVLYGQWLAQGTHVNAVGSNYITKAELDVEVFRRAPRSWWTARTRPGWRPATSSSRLRKACCTGPTCASWARWSSAATPAEDSRRTLHCSSRWASPWKTWRRRPASTRGRGTRGWAG